MEYCVCMGQERQTNQKYINRYIKDTYRTFKFRVRKENQHLIDWLCKVGNKTQYIISLIEEDIKRKVKYNYLDDSVKIDFELPLNIKNLVDDAEKADLEDDYGLYMNLACAIDTNAKNATAKRMLNDYQWETLVRRFRV